MVTLLDKLLDFCSSLKLAIILIATLALYLAMATVYEAQYGTKAVQDVIYGSQPFILLMAMLAINVMAAVLVRFPWKRKQTGFIITHCGIETLLLGCLISFRFSVDGRFSFTPGQKTEAINLNDEQVNITVPDAAGRSRTHVIPIHLWHDAGYPGLARFSVGEVDSKLADLADSFGLDSAATAIRKTLPLNNEIRWPAGHSVDYPLGPTAKLSVIDWLPAAVPETVLEHSAAGFPGAIVHLGGSMPNGMAMDQTVPLLADGQGNGMVRPFGGTLEMNIWKARSADEVHEFLNPPDPTTLPEMGRLAIFLNGTRYTLDITKEKLGQLQPLGDSGFAAAADDYILHAPPPQLPENHGQAAIASEPIDPQISFRLVGPRGTKKFLLAAWHPQFMAHLDGADAAAQHGATSADDPLVWYWHPQTYVTTKEGTRGRLWLIQSPDNKLYGRVFQLVSAEGPKAPFEVQVGKEMPHTWLNISLSIAQYDSSGVLVNEYRPAHVDPKQMEDHERAVKVALDIDGSRQESWLALGDGPVELNTPRGPVDLDYGFKEFELGFGIQLNHAEQTNDPGSNEAAAYSSEVSIVGSGKLDGDQQISMNEPITVNGLTFYQAGFSNDQVVMSTLSVREDPGRWLKNLGCLGIVGGIFTMFYMKAYFQRSPAPKWAEASGAQKVQKLAGASKAG